MAASVSIRVYTGASATVESAAQTGIDLVSSDNATNSTTNRALYPITAGDNSYEKWIKAYVDTAADNYVDTFELYGDGDVQASTVLYVGTTSSGATPTSGTSTVAVNTWIQYTSGAKLGWHATDLTTTGSTSVFAVFQLDTAADAAAGNWTQETISYSFNEA